MSKQTECERKLAHVTAQRDQWRTIAQQRAAELMEINRQFERAQLWHTVLVGGALPAIDNQIEQLQRQRDDALLERNGLLQVIARVRNDAYRDYEETSHQFDEYRAM